MVVAVHVFHASFLGELVMSKLLSVLIASVFAASISLNVAAADNTKAGTNPRRHRQDRTRRGLCASAYRGPCDASQLLACDALRPRPHQGGEDWGENSPENSRFEPLNLVGTGSTRVPKFLPNRWGRGGTRPYQNQMVRPNSS